MSRIKRALIRRDKAWTLMEKLEKNPENAYLNIKERLTLLFKDIPSEKIGTIPKNFKTKNYEWQTICIAARIASISGIWDLNVQELEHYLPSIDLRTFKHNWEQYRQDTSKDATDFLSLLRLAAV